jgi:hypothetical protein
VIPSHSPKTQTIYHRDGRERTVDVHEASRLAGTGTVGADKEWSFYKPPPSGWERETPKYRASRDIKPALKARYRSETPFANISDSDVWQYGEQPVKAGEIIETREWPHPSFRPLNYSAEKVLAFFNGAMKSRLTRSPWYGDGVRLDNGLSDAPAIFNPKPPKIKPVDMRPIS